MLDNPMPHQKKLWNQRAKAVIKNEELLKQNLRALYAVVMSLCDPIMEDKVSCHKEFARIKCTRNTFKLLQVIKQLKYSNGSKEIHAVHNHVMATINLFKMQQERGQSPQKFQEQFIATRQVCEQMGLHIRESKQGKRAILKKEG